MSASPPPPAALDAEEVNPSDIVVDSNVANENVDVDIDEDEDEDERPRKRLAFPPRPPADIGADGTLPTTGNDQDIDVDVDVDVDEEGEGEYVAATATQAAKIPKFKKTRRTSDDDEDEVEEEDDDDDEERRRRRKKKKRMENNRKRRERGEDDDVDVDEDEEGESQPVYDEATQRRMALEERIDNIGKKAKVTRRKKKGDDEDIVDSYHDEICARLRDRMISAADKDEAANRQKLPGTAKLAMLDEVMGVLRNTTLWQSIVDNGVLEAVKRWLEPLPDRSLPSVGIQKAIFEVLPKMDLDTTTLKECRIGPIVLFYTKTKRVTPSINRQADALVQSWSRPIIKRPANFRSRQVDTQDDLPLPSDSQGRDRDEMELSQTQHSQALSLGGGSQQRTKARRFDIKTALAENAGRKGARLQIVKDIQYTVAPESRTQHLAEEIQHVSRIQMDNKKFNKFARQMKAGRK
ncbi:transcription factor IWS1 [Kwoniella bestiolae CBS 10118]|uniref:Transcription factor IWS1 n=1 Tax=Kwoniella bestiolae CBS 10118 TaxID=1296100 RepID=A0A1B9GER2_9TREE|nr:transcription factor IWS1 [Kwoniella bestiolae CBS 10118]OCF29479.1 transcription factor IWS1 [Kwoniella bestiolae CBS 10118]